MAAFISSNVGLCGFEGDQRLFMATKELVDNATDSARTFMEPLANVEIVINVETARSGCCISVQDSGPGIAIEMIEGIGNAFQSSKSDLRTTGCFGIGLKALIAGIPCDEFRPLVMEFLEPETQTGWKMNLGLDAAMDAVKVFEAREIQFPGHGVRATFITKSRPREVEILEKLLRANLAARQIHHDVDGKIIQWTLTWEEDGVTTATVFSNQVWLAENWSNRLGLGQRTFTIIGERERKSYDRRGGGRIHFSAVLYQRRPDLCQDLSLSVQSLSKTEEVSVELVRLVNGSLLHPNGSNCHIVQEVEAWLKRVGGKFGIRRVLSVDSTGTSMEADPKWLPDLWSVRFVVRTRMGTNWDSLLLILEAEGASIPWANLSKTSLSKPKSGHGLISAASVSRALESAFEELKIANPRHFMSLKEIRTELMREIFVPSVIESVGRIAKRSGNPRLAALLRDFVRGLSDQSDREAELIRDMCFIASREDILPPPASKRRRVGGEDLSAALETVVKDFEFDDSENDVDPEEPDGVIDMFEW